MQNANHGRTYVFRCNDKNAAHITDLEIIQLLRSRQHTVIFLGMK